MSFEEDIAQINAQIEALREQAEPATRQFLHNTVLFLCDWARRNVDRAVTSHPELTKQLGKERLSRLKIELAQLNDEMPEHVQKHLNQKELWLHRGEIQQQRAKYSLSPYEFSGNRPPDKLNDKVRMLLGYTGALLVKFGFAKYDRNSVWELDSTGASPKYKYGFDWSQGMKTTLNRYADVYYQLSQLAESLESTKRKKAEAEAKQLWDQA
ncbi:MAG: hypothetical protein ACLQVJ_08585 [Syntrophobacteraceae bacterium]